MPQSKKNEMLESFEYLPKENRWKACMEAMDSTYTISVKEVCRLLMCDRSWVSKYVRPHVHYIYIASGAGKNANYLQAASKMLGKQMTESVWLHTQEFKELIYSHIEKCTRQTIAVPRELLIRAEAIPEFQEQYRKLEEQGKQFAEKGNLDGYMLVMESINKLMEEYMHDIGKQICEKLPSAYKRTETEAVDCRVPEFSLEDWTCVPDMKDYGDSDEEIYRRLFQQGYYRMEMVLTDANEKQSRKIYHLKPKDGNFGVQDSVGSILIGYREYIKLLK